MNWALLAYFQFRAIKLGNDPCGSCEDLCVSQTSIGLDRIFIKWLAEDKSETSIYWDESLLSLSVTHNEGEMAWSSAGIVGFLDINREEVALAYVRPIYSRSYNERLWNRGPCHALTVVWERPPGPSVTVILPIAMILFLIHLCLGHLLKGVVTPCQASLIR